MQFRYLMAVGIIGGLCAFSVAFAGELHDAVRANDQASVDALLAKGADVDESDFIFGTPLHIAALQGNSDIAKTLIEHGAGLEAVSEQQGSRSLHLAAEFGHVSVVALLLDNRANIEAKDDHKRTPLMRAAAGGHPEAVRLLLDRGADFDAREGKYGQAPIHEAAFQGRFEVIRLLLEYGADVRVTDNTGLTPLRMAALPQSFSRIGDASLLEYLVVHGADPNAKDTSGMSILAHARHHAGSGSQFYRQIVEALIRLGAKD